MGKSGQILSKLSKEDLHLLYESNTIEGPFQVSDYEGPCQGFVSARYDCTETMYVVKRTVRCRCDFDIGQDVKARFPTKRTSRCRRGYSWFYGKISAVNKEDGEYNVRFTDGEYTYVSPMELWKTKLSLTRPVDVGDVVGTEFEVHRDGSWVKVTLKKFQEDDVVYECNGKHEHIRKIDLEKKTRIPNLSGIKLPEFDPQNPKSGHYQEQTFIIIMGELLGPLALSDTTWDFAPCTGSSFCDFQQPDVVKHSEYEDRRTSDPTSPEKHVEKRRRLRGPTNSRG